MEYFSLIFTNHSLRATCATQLFDAGVPEALVQKQTGNKTLESLCLYERVTDNQRKVFSDIIQPVVDPDSAYSSIRNEYLRFHHCLTLTFFIISLYNFAEFVSIIKTMLS